MDEIERRLAATELLLEILVSALPAEQLDEVRRRLAEVAGLDEDGLAAVAQARRMASDAEQLTVPPATGAALAAALLARALKP